MFCIALAFLFLSRIHRQAGAYQTAKQWPSSKSWARLPQSTLVNSYHTRHPSTLSNNSRDRSDRYLFRPWAIRQPTHITLMDLPSQWKTPKPATPADFWMQIPYELMNTSLFLIAELLISLMQSMKQRERQKTRQKENRNNSEPLKCCQTGQSQSLIAVCVHWIT